MSSQSIPDAVITTQRADALAVRLEQGSSALAAFASALTTAEWQTRIPKDGRQVGVVVHHVATMYMEDHAVRHSHHHLARIRAALGRAR